MIKDEMKNRISLALKDPILQQGFEIICKENAELKEKINILENCDRLGDMITEAYKDQLTKAIELHKETQGYIENIDDILYDEIEQFIKEIEK